VDLREGDAHALAFPDAPQADARPGIAAQEEQEVQPMRTGMRTDVLVIGGGAAGVEVATAVAAALRRAASGPQVTVTVVAPSGELVYRPWLVYLPAGKLDPQALRLPMDHVARRGRFSFQQGEVRELRLDHDQAVLADGQTVHYRCVVVAAGAPADRARIPGAARHALFPCDQPDALRLAQTISQQPNRDPGPDLGRDTGGPAIGPVTFVASGERIGPPLEFAGWTARRLYADTSASGANAGAEGGPRVRLVDDDGAFARQFGPAADKVAAVVGSLGIEVVRGSSVVEVAPGTLRLADGRTLAASLVAIASPLRGPGPDLGLPAAVLDPRGFVTADQALRIRGYANAFVAGDALHLPVPGVALPKTWGMARLQAATVAANIVALLTDPDRPPAPFDLRRVRRLAGLSMPDVGGRTVLVRKGRALASGAWPLRLRYRLDRSYLRRYRPTPEIPTPGRL